MTMNVKLEQEIWNNHTKTECENAKKGSKKALKCVKNYSK